MAAFTRRLGPAPVWLWAVAALAGIYLWHRHAQSAAAQSTAVPVSASTTGADTGATGSSSSPLDSSNGDLLSSLLDNTNAYQQLLATLQAGDVGVGSGGAPGGSGGGASGGVPAGFADTTMTTAPTVVGGAPPATTAASASTASGAQLVSYAAPGTTDVGGPGTVTIVSPLDSAPSASDNAYALPLQGYVNQTIETSSKQLSPTAPGTAVAA